MILAQILGYETKCLNQFQKSCISWQSIELEGTRVIKETHKQNWINRNKISKI